jgi:uncharacterized protein YpmS
MKKLLFKYVLLFIGLLCLISCTGRLEKTWILKKFDEEKVFRMNSEKGKSYSTAIVTISGNVDKEVCFTLDKNASSEWCHYFSVTDSKIQFTTDFYGIGTFKLYMLTSKAKGELKVTIELPYSE